jgi:hypothetical protein
MIVGSLTSEVEIWKMCTLIQFELFLYKYIYNKCIDNTAALKVTE